MNQTHDYGKFLTHRSKNLKRFHPYYISKAEQNFKIKLIICNGNPMNPTIINMSFLNIRCTYFTA